MGPPGLEHGGGRGRVVKLLCVWAVLVALASGSAHSETCRFAGTTSHDGHLDVRSEVTEAGGLVTVDVALVFSVSAWLSDVRYLSEEISTWRRGTLQSVAVNNRTIVGGHVTRQQWDVMERAAAGGLAARRVQAKTRDDFARRHPAFLQHWPLDGFGQPWLQDYAAARPEPRADLGLAAGSMPADLRTPLALAFFWSRHLPADGGTTPVFLPGFKHDALTGIAYGPATQGSGWRRWQITLRYPGLEGAPSIAAAWVSPDGYLLQLAADVHAQLGSGQALLRSQGCQGVQVSPD